MAEVECPNCSTVVNVIHPTFTRTELLDTTNDLMVALAEVRRLRAGIEAVCSFLPPTSETHIALSALVDPSEDIYSQF